MTPMQDRSTPIPDGMSPVFFPVGAVSDNGVAILGSMGHLFVRGGSNSALEQYERWQQADQVAELERVVDGWVTLAKSRSERVTGRGARFVQTVIPEKSSLYPHLLPPEYRHINGPTEALARINTILSRDSDWFLNAYAVLSNDRSGYDMWPRTGSHWTPAGARALTAEIINYISVATASLLRGIVLSSSAEIEADLGKHLLGPTVSEERPAADAESLPFGKSLSRLELDYDGSPKHSSWRCNDALIDQRVLIFGNSYTQVVPMPDRLSWWFARIFRESKFVWTPEVQDEIIDLYEPDLVIAQGIERFLPTIPSR